MSNPRVALSRHFMAMFLVSLMNRAVNRKALLYVDETDTGANDGSSWCDTFLFFKDSLVAATTRNGDADPNNDITEIRIAQGTHTPDRNAASTTVREDQR